jgi:glycosyltransferase involved in cell wall biosynthesis
MRFVMLTTFYPPFNFGGDGVDVERTARALVKRGHEVTVVHDIDAYQWLAGRQLPDQPRTQDGVEVVGLRSRLGVVSPLLTHQFGKPVVHGRAMEKLIRDRQADVVVFHNVSLVGGPGLLALGAGAFKIYVAHEHWLVCPTHVLWRFNREPCDERSCGKCVLAYRRPPQIWRYTSALERQLPQVDMFIARSQFSRRKHQEFGFKPPMSVLPYFLPGTIPSARTAALGPRPQERPYFLFVGRLTKIKGLHAVIPAFANYPGADLLIVGDGEEMNALKDLAKGLSNVKFVGRVRNDQLDAYYEHAIAAIFPSLGYETFGLVLIEAMRFGTPVIARRIGPLPEIVEQSGGGLLFANNDELIAAMTRIQNDQVLRDSLGASGYGACRKYWSEDVVIGKFLEMTNEALKSRARPAAR